LWLPELYGFANFWVRARRSRRRSRAARRNASQQPSFTLTALLLVAKLVADLGASHRSVNSAEANNCSLVIDESELANSTQNRLGPISG
jgi:hypothetical protein